MHTHVDPLSLGTMHELATILARGVLRQLRLQRAAVVPESPPIGLELSAPSPLSVVTTPGLTPYGDGDRE